MKEMFREFYQKETLDFSNLPKDALVVIDANVLLHVFRFSIDSRKKLLDSIKMVSNNLWIPYVAAVEYHFNKQSILRELRQKKELVSKGDTLSGAIDTLIVAFEEELDTFGNLIRSTDEFEIRSNIKGAFSEGLRKFVNDFKAEKVCDELNLIGEVEDLSNELAETLAGKIEGPLNQVDIDKIEKEGEERYSMRFPPGYKDSAKKDIRRYGDIKYQQKYGDLLIWKSILDKAKEGGYTKVIFVSDDLKEDWIYETKGEKVGPRVELKKELLNYANADLFLMGSATFISQTSKEQSNVAITKGLPIEPDLADDSELVSYLNGKTYRIEQGYKTDTIDSLIDSFKLIEMYDEIREIQVDIDDIMMKLDFEISSLEGTPGFKNKKKNYREIVLLVHNEIENFKSKLVNGNITITEYEKMDKRVRRFRKAIKEMNENL